MLSRILCCLVALAPLWVLGIIHLPHPFDGDQALFMVGAKTIEAGGRLYIPARPLGILAVRGIDVILGGAGGWKTQLAAAALALTLLGPALPEQGMKTLAFLQEYQRRTPWLHDYQRAIDPEEKRIWQETQFLRNESPAEPIYVFGNPLYLYLSGRSQALPEHGWSWETFLPSQWVALPDKVRKAKPVWLYVEVNNAGLIADHSPATCAVFDELYEPAERSAAGTWYHLRSSVAATK